MTTRYPVGVVDCGPSPAATWPPANAGGFYVAPTNGSGPLGYRIPNAAMRAAGINCFVVNVGWNILQTTNGGALRVSNPIDRALADVRALNIDEPGLDMTVVIRVFAGIRAPAWAKSLGGSPVSVWDTFDGKAGTVGRWWTAAFQAGYHDLQNKLAAAYDGEPEIVGNVVSLAALFYPEQYVGSINQSNPTHTTTTGQQLHAAFLTYQKAKDAILASWTLHDAWAEVSQICTFNPANLISDTGGQHATDEAFTESSMDDFVATLPDLAVVANYSLRKRNGQIGGPAPQAIYAAMYAHMRTLGVPIMFQTARKPRLCEYGTSAADPSGACWEDVYDWATTTGQALAVETIAEYQTDYDPDLLGSYAARMAAGTPTPEPGEIHPSGFDAGAHVGSPTLSTSGTIGPSGFDAGAHVGSPTLHRPRGAGQGHRKHRMSLGKVFQEITGPDGTAIHPTVSDWQAEEDAPGGMGPASGLVTDRYFQAHRDVLRQGAVWRTYLESDNTCIHGGLLTEPDTSGAQVALSDRGWSERAEKETEAIDYLMAGIEGWSRGDAEPFMDPTATSSGAFHDWTLSSEHGFRWAFRSHASRNSTGPAMVFWAPGQDLRRLGLKLHIDADNPVQFVVQALDDSEVPGSFIGGAGVIYDTVSSVDTLDLDLDLRDVIDGAEFWPVTLVAMFPVVDGDDGTTDAIVEVEQVEVGVLRDGRLSPSGLVRDLAGRLGMRHRSAGSLGINVLPWHLEDGATYADGFDYADLMSGWRTIFRDTGFHAYIEHAPWDDSTFEVTSPHSPFEPIGQDRYDAVRVPFLLADKASVGYVRVRSPRRLDRRNLFPKLSLPSPAHDRDNAENLGQAVLRAFERHQWSGSGSHQTVAVDGREVSAHRIFAGMTADGSPVGKPSDVRIGSVTHTYDGVATSFTGGVPPLERLLARRAHRMAVKHAA